jgi:glycosyltransferase involved in cell wall biosynthesis
MKIGWFTPFNPHSAVGNYSEAVCAALTAGGDEVTVFASEPDGQGEPRPAPFPVVRLAPHVTPACLEQFDRFDLLVYNMGNHMPYHRKVYDLALCRPGLVILHDIVLRDFFEGYYLLHRDAPDEFARLLTYSHGPDAEERTRDVHAGPIPEASKNRARLDQPMFQPALRRCLGAVVHSDYALRRVREVGHAPSTKVEFPLFGPTARLAARPPAPARPQRGRVRLLTVGHVNPNKMIHAVIDAIRESDFLRQRVTYTVIGNSSDELYSQQLRTLVATHGLRGTVELAGWCGEDRVVQALLGADVVINLRNPHFGESSASLLDSLVAGVVTVVWDHGYYAEFPDDVVCKVSSEQELAPLLERLVEEPDWRRGLGRNARAHALARFDTGRYCEQFRTFAAEVLRQKPALRLADHVSDRLVELGAGSIDDLAERMAAEVAFFVRDEAAAARAARAAA